MEKEYPSLSRQSSDCGSLECQSLEMSKRSYHYGNRAYRFALLYNAVKDFMYDQKKDLSKDSEISY
jgi:hypothetical protein